MAILIRCQLYWKDKNKEKEAEYFFAKQFIHFIKRDTKEYNKQIITYF